jgi:phage tail protein X
MEYLTHQPTDGQRIDSLADYYYGDPNLIEPILMANPHLFGQLVTAAGAALKIPIIEQPDPPPAAGMPPWRQ